MGFINLTHVDAYRIHPDIKLERLSTIDSRFFDWFMDKGVVDVADKKERFQSARLKFHAVLPLGLDADSFFEKLKEHLQQKGLGIKLCAISVVCVFNDLEICTEYRACGLLELDKKVDTYSPVFFSPQGITVVYKGLGFPKLSLSAHLSKLIIDNQINAGLTGWFYSTPGWLSKDQMTQLMWAAAVTKDMRWLFECVGLSVESRVGPVLAVHPDCLKPKDFDMLYAFYIFRNDLEVLLDELLSEDNCLYKTTVLKENTDVINVLLFRDQAQLFKVFEASLFNFKEHVPPEYISWSL